MVSEECCILIFGVVLCWVEIGYGYLEFECEVGDEFEVMLLKCFVEKLDVVIVEQFVVGGCYFWNVGNFVFCGDVFFECVVVVLFELVEGFECFFQSELDQFEYGVIYGELLKILVDYGVMECQDDLMMVFFDCGWNDVGLWQVLVEFVDLDDDGNCVCGCILIYEVQNNFVYVDGVVELKMVVFFGVDDFVVVQIDDVILVMLCECSQQVCVFVDVFEVVDDEVLF